MVVVAHPGDEAFGFGGAIADVKIVSATNIVGDRFVDLVDRGFDLAVRVGVLADTSARARKLADEIRHTAEEESQRIIADAQLRAEDLVQNMGPRLQALDREISDLRKRREQATSGLAATVVTLRKTLETVRTQA